MTSYQIYRRTASETILLLESIGPQLSYHDIGALDGTENFYVVTAANAGGEGDISNEEPFTP